MAIIPTEFDGVFTDRFHVVGLGGGLEHGQGTGSQLRRNPGLAAGLAAFLIAQSARAGVPKIDKTVAGPVPVFPFDIHARAGRDIDFDRLGISRGLHVFSIAQAWRRFPIPRPLSAVFCSNVGYSQTEVNFRRRTPMAEEAVIDRIAIAGRGRRLEYFTIGWNCLEGVVGIVAGLIAGSISLVGFGIDSFIEVTSGAALLWRMSVDADVDRRERNERIALRTVGLCFIALAAYIAYESIADLRRQQAPERSIPGIILACVSLLVMPLLSRAKRRVGTALGSAAMHADARQTDFCVYLSAILLGGLLLNALFGWWWADPVAALIMAPIIAKEGIEGIRGKACHDCRE